MSTQLQILNRALIRLGEDRLRSTTDDVDTARKIMAIYDSVLETVTAEGPLLGWKFARRRNTISVDSTDITAFADYSGTATGTVSCTSSGHGLSSGEQATIDGTTSYDGDYEVTVIDSDTFYFTDTWVADDATGTVSWTSNEYECRFPCPDNLRIVSVNVGGVELTDWVREGAYILTNKEDEELDMLYVQSITTTSLFPPHFVKVFWMSLAIELAYDVIQSAKHAPSLMEELYSIVLPKAIAMDEREKYVKESSTSWVDIGHTTETIE